MRFYRGLVANEKMSDREVGDGLQLNWSQWLEYGMKKYDA